MYYALGPKTLRQGYVNVRKHKPQQRKHSTRRKVQMREKPQQPRGGE